jgi:proton-dependent oligopeptide transporter, POT family
VTTTQADAVPPKSLGGRLEDAATTIGSLLRLPRAFWYVNLIFLIDGMAYFGVLTLMDVYLPRDLGLSDWQTSLTMSFFTGLVTLLMIGLGGLVEHLGVRLGITAALFLCLVGRIGYAGASMLGLGLAGAVCIVLTSLLVTAIGEAAIQPVCYAGIKFYTDEKNSSAGYGLIYGLMNLGIFLIGLISPLVRVPIEKVYAARAAGGAEPATIWRFFVDWHISGINAVNWICVAITVLGLLVVLVLFNRRTEAQRLRGADPVPAPVEGLALPWTRRVVLYFSEGPFSNARFLFFVFMTLPVQTLFAVQLFTLPAYVLRAYPQAVQDHMEWVVNWINPGIIVFGAPLIATLTRKASLYRLVLVGSLFSALPSLLLVPGPNTGMLITYLVLFSIGEALWQPRFLEFAAELAPPGKVAQYMGLANVPWVTAKMTTGLYSGYLLGRYCPEPGPGVTLDPHATGIMWLVFSVVAVLTPIGLLLGRRWVMRGSLGAPRPAAA